ncbi:MAG: hypothetical protein KZQ56_12270 [gamma proteobacterium symbiont of Lucinoma myriamae]|nr:hypothetical protein [gamma proteobacterium symbiont of Lucinoma myriamae]
MSNEPAISHDPMYQLLREGNIDPKKRSSPCNDIISSTKLLIIELFFSRLEQVV